MGQSYPSGKHNIETIERSSGLNLPQILYPYLHDLPSSLNPSLRRSFTDSYLNTNAFVL